MSKQAQYVSAAVISVIVIFYVLALVAGFIPERGRIDFSTLLLILITIGAVVTLLYPTAMSTFGDILGRVTTVEIASMKFALADIRAKQIDQECHHRYYQASHATRAERSGAQPPVPQPLSRGN